MPWTQTGATHYHAELGLPDKHGQDGYRAQVP